MLLHQSLRSRGPSRRHHKARNSRQRRHQRSHQLRQKFPPDQPETSVPAPVVPLPGPEESKLSDAPTPVLAERPGSAVAPPRCQQAALSRRRNRLKKFDLHPRRPRHFGLYRKWSPCHRVEMCQEIRPPPRNYRLCLTRSAPTAVACPVDESLIVFPRQDTGWSCKMDPT